MTRRLVNLGSHSPILDIVSLGRAAPGSWTPAQLALIARTVSRSPEVMVKVSGGARSLRGAAAHFGYISRQATLDVETDMGETIRDKQTLKSLIQDWDLDLEIELPSARHIRRPARTPKLVHNLIFSMPAGTPSGKVLRAVRKLVQEEWELKHRYAMVLHTDEPHPHVHVVLKARSENGPRLNIRKATLRNWRQQFATNLRELGVAANATERTVRGQARTHLPDGLYRGRERGDLAFVDRRNDAAGHPGLDATQRAVEQGWRDLANKLAQAGHTELAKKAHEFVDDMRWRRIDRASPAVRPGQQSPSRARSNPRVSTPLVRH